jgi:hypothetical protein
MFWEIEVKKYKEIHNLPQEGDLMAEIFRWVDTYVSIVISVMCACWYNEISEAMHGMNNIMFV